MRIGIDIGGNHIGIGLVDDRGNILIKEEKDLVEINHESNMDIKQLLISQIIQSINVILEKKLIQLHDIEKIGIAAPGIISNGIITNACNLGIVKFRIVEELKKYYSIPITLRNDAKCAGIAENKCGALKKYNNSVFMTIGTGIGGAVFLNGELMLGKENDGVEIGHIVIQKDGKECKCGNKGCFERYASITALKEQVIQNFKLQQNITGMELLNFIQENIYLDKMKNIIQEYIQNLAIGISNLINIFEPEVVCLGGSIVYYKDIVLEELIRLLPQYCFGKRVVPILLAENKNDAGIIGASLA